MADIGATLRIGGDNKGALDALRGIQDAMSGVQGQSKSAGTSFLELGQMLHSWTENIKNFAGTLRSAFDRAIGKSIDLADQIGQIAEQTGVATDSLQRLKFAAEQNDSSLGSLTAGLKFLQRNMGEAIGGSKEAAAKFKSLGLTVKDLKNLSTEDVFKRIADVMANTAIPQATKMSLAMSVMGRGAMDLIPMLKSGSAAISELGSEAESLGAVLSKDAIAATKAFTDNLKVLDTAGLGLSNIFLERISPSLEALSGKLREQLPRAIEAARPYIQRIGDWFVTVADKLIANLPLAIHVAGVAFDELAKSLGEFYDDQVKGFIVLNNNMTKARSTIVATWEIVGPIVIDYSKRMLDGLVALGEYTGDEMAGKTSGSTSWADHFRITAHDVSVAIAGVRAKFYALGATIEHWARQAALSVFYFGVGIGKSLPSIWEYLKALTSRFTDTFRGIGDTVTAGVGGLSAAWKAYWEGGDPMKAFNEVWDPAMRGIDLRVAETTERINKASAGIDLFGPMNDALLAEDEEFANVIAQIDAMERAEISATDSMLKEIEERIAARKREGKEVDLLTDLLNKAKAAMEAAGDGHTTVAIGGGDGDEPGKPGGGDGSERFGAAVTLHGAQIAAGFGSLGGQGSLVGVGHDVAGVRFTEVKRFKSEIERDEFMQRQSMEEAIGAKRQNINDSLTGKAKRQALESLDAEHKANLSNILKEQSQSARIRGDLDRAYALEKERLSKTTKGREQREGIEALKEQMKRDKIEAEKARLEKGKGGAAGAAKPPAEPPKPSKEEQEKRDTAQRMKEAVSAGMVAAQRESQQPTKSDWKSMFDALAEAICKCVNACCCCPPGGGPPPPPPTIPTGDGGAGRRTTTTPGGGDGMVRYSVDSEGRPVFGETVSGGGAGGGQTPGGGGSPAGGQGGGAGGSGGAGGGGGPVGLGGPFVSSQGATNQIGWHGGQQGGRAGGSASNSQISQWMANMQAYKAGAMSAQEAIAPAGMNLIAGGGGAGSGNLFAMYANPDSPVSAAVQMMMDTYKRTQESRLGITPEGVDPTGMGRTPDGGTINDLDVAKSENTTVNGDTVIVNSRGGDKEGAGNNFATLGTFTTGDGKIVTLKDIRSDTPLGFESPEKLRAMGLSPSDIKAGPSSSVTSAIRDLSKYGGGLFTTGMAEELSRQILGSTSTDRASAQSIEEKTFEVADASLQEQKKVVTLLENLNKLTEEGSTRGAIAVTVNTTSSGSAEREARDQAKRIAEEIETEMRKPQQGTI